MAQSFIIPAPKEKFEEVAEPILEMLSGAEFEKWYETDFMDYVEGEENAKTKREILYDIARMVD